MVGYGISNIEELLKKNDRFLLQLEVLRKSYGDGLQKVLSLNELYVLVPYGNHLRGAKFLDLTGLVDIELTDNIDRICKAIPEFYYGYWTSNTTLGKNKKQERIFLSLG